MPESSLPRAAAPVTRGPRASAVWAARVSVLLVSVLFCGTTVLAGGSARLRARSAPQSPRIETPPVQETSQVVLSNRGFLDTSGRGKRTTAPGASPLVVGKSAALAPVEVLPAALVTDRERVAEIAEWNATPGSLLKEGFARSFSAPVEVTLDEASMDAARKNGRHAGGVLSEASSGMVAWTGHARLVDAARSRLHLSRVELPRGSAVWAYGEDGIPQGPVAAEFATPEGGLWCPSVTGGDVWIEVQVPAASLARGERCSFAIDAALEIFRLDDTGRPHALGADKQRGDPTCLMDVNCVTSTEQIENASKAIGGMHFVSGGSGFVCTGGLLNDQASTGTPYFLTANHCLNTPAEVASLEVWFDYKTLGCNGAVPDESTLPKSFGGTLLVAGSGTDVTFIELPDLPAERFFFGWLVGDPSRELLQRVANAGGGPQRYSETRSNGGMRGGCSSLPQANFLYQDALSAGISGGSSGSPVWIGDNLVVGQLFGTCGPTGGTSCDGVTQTVDGRFSESFQILSAWLTPNAPSVPDNLRATKVKKKKLTLIWTDAATDETKYEVASLVDGEWITVGTLAPNTRTVEAKRLVPGTTYRIGVRACRNSTCSAYAAVIVTTKGG